MIVQIGRKAVSKREVHSEAVANPVTKKRPMVIFEVLYDEDESVDTDNFIQLSE